MDFVNMDFLRFLGHVSLVFSIIAIAVVVYHWKFFNRVQKSELAKRMSVVFLSDVFMYGSIMLYGLNWILFDGSADWRLFLKAVQVLSIVFNLYALSRLIGYYKKVG